MKIIKVMETVYDIKTLYKEASTQAQRALVGYMLKTGKTNDVILGGAFTLVKDVERCKGKLYKLITRTAAEENEKQIISIAETAMAGGFNQFALSKREIRRTLKRIANYV